MPSLKRHSSNADLFQNCIFLQNQNVIKIAKRSNSLKATPLTIKRKISAYSSGDAEFRENDFKGPKGFPLYNIKKYRGSSSSTTCSTSHSEHNFKKYCKKLTFPNNKNMSKKLEYPDDSSYFGVQKTKGENAFKQSYGDQQATKISAMEFHSTYMRNSYSKSVEDISNIICNTKTKIKRKKFYSCWSSKSKSANSSSTSLSEHAVMSPDHEECEVKSILKSSLSRKCSDNMKKKVRFNLGPENDIPRSLKYLYRPLSNVDKYENQKSLVNTEVQQIPEKETPIKIVKKTNDRFKVTPTELIYSERNYHSSPNDRNFIQAEREGESKENIDYISSNKSYINDTRDKRVLSELTPNEVKKNFCRRPESEDICSRINYEEVGKSDQKEVYCSNNYHKKSYVTDSECVNFPEVSISEENLRPISRNSELRIPTNINSVSCDKSPLSKINGVRSGENDVNNDNLYNLLIDKLLKCPEQELPNFLRTVSSIISTKETSYCTNSLNTLKDLLDEFNQSACHQTPKCSVSDDTKWNENNKGIEYECCRSLYVPDYERSSLSSNSSVTTVSSLPSSVPSKENFSHKVNMKSFQFLHQCLEETFCYDNLSGSEKSHARTEYRNYSHSCSTDSKRNDNFLNDTLQRLTTLLEELNSKVDKIKINDESQDSKTEVLLSNEEPLQTNLGEFQTEYSTQSIEFTNVNESNQQTKAQDKTSIVEPNFSEFELKLEDGIYKKEPNIRSYRTEDFLEPHIGEDTITIEGDQSTRISGRSEKAGIIFYSQSGSEAFIKFIDKPNSDSRQILPCHSQLNNDITKNKNIICDGNISYSSHGNENNSLVQVAPNHEFVSISNNDVQSILKQITKELNKVKLTSPTMYEPGFKRHHIEEKKSDTSIKTISQTVQKKFNNLMQSIRFKFLLHRDKLGLKRKQFKEGNNEKRGSSNEAVTSNLLRIIFPFCRPMQESDDIQHDIHMFQNWDKNVEKETPLQTENEETDANDSITELWPDIKRTKYPNGMLHYGPLERMPEPKIFHS